MVAREKKAWYLANTTIRNAKRIKDGLAALVDSPLHGNLEGRSRERQFAELLNKAGIVRVKRFQEDNNAENIDEIEGAKVDSNDASDVGRKWRAAMMQMGFITPGPETAKQFSEPPYTVTPNGKRLILSTTLPEEQECFLRALLALQLPSQVDKYNKVPPFSPFRIVLEILTTLEKKGLEAWLTQEEMAFIVQLMVSLEEVDQAVQKIAWFRQERQKAINPRAFSKDFRREVASQVKGQNEDTIYTYADANFRYLKLTGLFAEGNRLRFSDYKRIIIQQILSTPYTLEPPEKYLSILWNGASLPTDNAAKAIEAIRTTEMFLRKREGKEQTDGLLQLEMFTDLTQVKEADLSQLKLKLEDDLLKVLEADFARRQNQEWKDIVKHFRELISSKYTLFAKGNAPEYFEWALWRAFLAINSLANKPWEARRFKIDQEFQPVSPAPGGGPDMIFEFEDFVIGVEVTLTTNSRQEAVEGEPVRRHIADLVDKYKPQGKPVYGLFLANKIDTNTAETFRGGLWYQSDDSLLELKIVPFTLKEFADLFEAAFAREAAFDYKKIEEIIIECINKKLNANAPQWKQRIKDHLLTTVQQIQNNVI